MDEAERYLGVLVARGFVSPVEISAAVNIKSFTVHRKVQEFIAKIAIDVNFVGANMPQNFARHLLVHNRIWLQECNADAEGNNFVALLPTLSASYQWQLLKLVDLEGCRGLKKHHLKTIWKRKMMDTPRSYGRTYPDPISLDRPCDLLYHVSV